MKYIVTKTTLIFFMTAFAFCINACKQTTNDKIKNGIEIKENGLHVEEAYLTDNNQTTIGDDNKVKVGERVCLRLVIDGWKVKDGKVLFDASQRTATSSGVTLAINPSMFGVVYAVGALPESAKYVLLYQTIGSLKNPADHVIITFNVWDKTTNKSVSGSYNLYLTN